MCGCGSDDAAIVAACSVLWRRRCCVLVGGCSAGPVLARELMLLVLLVLVPVLVPVVPLPDLHGCSVVRGRRRRCSCCFEESETQEARN